MVFSLLAQLVELLLDLGRLHLRTDCSKEVEILLLRRQLAFGPDVDLGAEATPRATERFGRRVPPFAPAAC